MCKHLEKSPNFLLHPIQLLFLLHFPLLFQHYPTLRLLFSFLPPHLTTKQTLSFLDLVSEKSFSLIPLDFMSAVPALVQTLDFLYQSSKVYLVYLHSLLLFVFSYTTPHMECGILVLQLRIEPTPTALEAPSLNHCPAGEAPVLPLNYQPHCYQI